MRTTAVIIFVILLTGFLISFLYSDSEIAVEKTYILNATEFYIYRERDKEATVISQIFKQKKDFKVSKDTLEFKQSIWESNYYTSTFGEYEFKRDTLISLNYTLNDSLRINWGN